MGRIVAGTLAVLFVLVAVSSTLVPSAGSIALASRVDTMTPPAVLGLTGVAGDGMPDVHPNDDVRALMAGIDRDRMLDELRRLTGEEPLCMGDRCRTLPERLTGSDNLTHAVDYVAEAGRALGYDVSVQPWMYAQYSDRNVIMRKRGTVLPKEEVWYVAHVDGIHCHRPNQDCPAADDNGSGTVAGLEVARLFAEVDFKRTLVLFISTGEEQGMLGVIEFLRAAPRAEIRAIHSLINSDMIGYDSDDDGVMELYHDDDPPSKAVARVMADVVDVYDIGLDVKMNSGCG